MILAFHKPYGVLSQFTREVEGQRTLAEFSFPGGVYPVGRLDSDSEGLLLLSDEKAVTDRLLNPRHGHERTYWAQVERVPDEPALDFLRRGGIDIRGHLTAPCRARLLHGVIEPPPREPPVRYRASVPTAWLELCLTEGKNRQVRRMTAAAGFPTLRLIRQAIGGYVLGELPPGRWVELSARERALLMPSSPRFSRPRRRY